MINVQFLMFNEINLFLILYKALSIEHFSLDILHPKL